MNDAKTKQQIVEKITGSTNVLVTVSKDPSVDALSAALGLTVMLNKLGKHTTAIFSGATPPAITFLDPQKMFESSIDSLRDFIIALDKEKADHLRYKVEGDAVKIFITPYRTTLSSEDLEFSQGDYNIELVLALGVENQSHLDAALEAHGSILHDATVITISTEPGSSSLGSIDWRDETASSLSEMLVTLSETLAAETPLIDQQVATALLTGIVAETDRFSNPKTSSKVMTMAAQLMAAGADQQLIASKLQESHEIGAGATPTGNASPYTQTLAQSAQLPTKDGMAITHDEVVPIASTSPVPPVPDQSSLPPVTPSPSVPPVPVDVAPVTVGKIADAYAFQPDEVTTDTTTPPPATAPLLGGVSLPPTLTAEPVAASNDVAPLSPIAPPQPIAPEPTPTPAPTTPSDTLAPATLGSLPPAPAEVTAPMSTEISKHSYLGGAPSTYDTPVNGAIAPAGEGGVDIFASPAPTMDGSVLSTSPPAPTSPALGTRDESSRNDALAAVHATFDQPAAQPFSPAPGITLPPPPPLPDFGALPTPAASSPYALDPQPTQPAPERLGDILAPEPAPITATPPPQSVPNDPGQFQIPGQ